MKKWLLLAFIAAGLATLGLFDWQDTLPEDASYIHIGVPILHHTWTCADGGTGCTSTTARNCSVNPGTTCNITVASTAAHSVEVLCGQFTTTSVTISSTSDGGFTAVAGSHGTDSTAGGVECAYNLNATGGATLITCTFSGSSSNACQYFRFTGTGSSFTFDTSGTVDDSTAATSQPGAAMTLGTSNNYILIQTASCAGTCSAINQSFTGSFPANGDGMAFKINVTTVGTTPTWTTTSGRLAGGAIAIYEVVSGPVAGFDKRKKYAKYGVN